MDIIVVGCGRLGSQLAYRLFKSGHEVAVVDSNPQAFNNLPPDFSGRLHEGDAMGQDVLLRAGIEKAHALAAVTNSDPLNAVVGHIARSVYYVPHVVVRNYDPHFRPIFEAFGLQTVSSTSWGAQRIEELIAGGDIRAVFSAGNGEVEIYEVDIPEAWNGHPIKELVSSKECILVALSRAGRAFLPAPEFALMTGDVLVVGATFEGITALRKTLQEGTR